MIHGFFRVDHELIESTMRADVEKQLNLIALGKADFKAVLIFLILFQKGIKILMKMNLFKSLKFGLAN